ncbi:MAG: hypothetical protein ACTS9Y_00665 [Methylophilus sp.]|uniref:hypothetical protein n=1 Tax=Methylophilus sp. TaxID=29541 RepID=UPI003FA004B8
MVKMAEKIDQAVIHMGNKLSTENQEWFGPTEIGKIVGGPEKHSAYGSPICKKAVESGDMIRNDKGHYRLTELGRARYKELSKVE